MIGLFTTSRINEGDDIVFVHLLWGSDGERKARIVISPQLRNLLRVLEHDGPTNDETLRAEVIFSYAVFVAMETCLPLRITGDLTVWRSEWGPLQKATS